MARICVIFNPAARGDKARRFRAHLEALSHQCALKPTTGPGSGADLAAEAVREGFDTIVAAGGDGTVNEVLNGLARSPHGPKRARFAVLPLGTINVFAKELDLPTRFEPAWQIILAGHETLIDLPFATFSSKGVAEKRYFAQMAGAGLDSRAVALVDWELKKKIGPLAYVVASLKAWRGPMPQLLVSDGTQTITAELVLIGNGRFYGGRYEAFPMADLRDAMLEVSIWPKVDLVSAIRTSWGLLTSQLYSAGGVRHFKAATLTVSATEPVPFHLDGEDAGMLPVQFGIEPRALRVIVP